MVWLVTSKPFFVTGSSVLETRYGSACTGQFEIRGSNTGDFTTGYTVWGRKAAAFPDKGTWSVTLPGNQSFRYLRLISLNNVSGMNFAETPGIWYIKLVKLLFIGVFAFN